MVYLVYRMRLTPSAQRDIHGFWHWLEQREKWFYRELPMVKAVRWFTTVIGDLYTVECWAAFDSESDYVQYRGRLATLKADEHWEHTRVSQTEWWEFLDSRLVADVPCVAGFGQFGIGNSSHSPASPSTTRVD